MKQEIIDERYDPEEFSNHLRAAKPGGDDVENWTLDELETQVYEFRNGKKTDGRKAKFESIELDNQKGFAFLTPCIKGKTSGFADDCKVSVDSGEIKPGGFFSSAEILFNLSTSPMGFKVKRNEANLKELQKNLAIEFPWTAIPGYTERVSRDINQTVVESQVNQAQRFLDVVFRHPQLRHSLILEVFLSAQNPNTFASQTKELVKILERKKQPSIKTPFSALVTPSGLVESKMTTRLAMSIESAETAIEKHNDFIQKVSDAFKELSEAQNNVNKAALKIRGLMKEWQFGAAQAAMRPLSCNKTLALPDLLGLIGAKMEKSSIFFREMAKNSQRFSEDIRMISKDFESITRLVKMRGDVSEAFIKQKIQLDTSKDELEKRPPELWRPGDSSVSITELPISKASRRGLLLPEQTKNVQRMAEFAGFVNTSVYREEVFMEANLFHTLKEGFLRLVKSDLEGVVNQHCVFADVSAVVQTIEEAIANKN